MMPPSIAHAGEPLAPPALAWPDAAAVYGPRFALTWSRRLKYALRLALTRDLRAELLRDVARLPAVEAAFRRQPRMFYPVMAHLADRRIGARTRLRMTQASLRVVCGAMPEDDQHRLLTQGLTLGRLADGSRISLGLNPMSFHEGLWEVALTGTDGMRLYGLNFVLQDDRTLLIANVQGGRIHGDGLDRMRDVTHAAHGMRPPHLLLHVLRLLAKHWGVRQLFGVDPDNHIKGTWNLRKKRLRFDYRGFWTEAGATPDAGGNWSLALETPLRPLEEIPSKRRAMYRRRYALLETLAHDIAALPGGAAGVPAPTATHAPGPRAMPAGALPSPA